MRRIDSAAFPIMKTYFAPILALAAIALAGCQNPLEQLYTGTWTGLYNPLPPKPAPAPNRPVASKSATTKPAANEKAKGQSQEQPKAPTAAPPKQITLTCNPDKTFTMNMGPTITGIWQVGQGDQLALTAKQINGMSPSDFNKTKHDPIPDFSGPIGLGISADHTQLTMVFGGGQNDPKIYVIFEKNK